MVLMPRSLINPVPLPAKDGCVIMLPAGMCPCSALTMIVMADWLLSLRWTAGRSTASSLSMDWCGCMTVTATKASVETGRVRKSRQSRKAVISGATRIPFHPGCGDIGSQSTINNCNFCVLCRFFIELFFCYVYCGIKFFTNRGKCSNF